MERLIKCKVKNCLCIYIKSMLSKSFGWSLKKDGNKAICARFIYLFRKQSDADSKVNIK